MSLAEQASFFADSNERRQSRSKREVRGEKGEKEKKHFSFAIASDCLHSLKITKGAGLLPFRTQVPNPKRTESDEN